MIKNALDNRDYYLSFFLFFGFHEPDLGRPFADAAKWESNQSAIDESCPTVDET